MTPRQQIGRVLVIAVIVLTLLVVASPLVLTARMSQDFIFGSVRLLIVAVMLFGVWHGVLWMRWVLAILTGMVGVYGLGYGVLETFVLTIPGADVRVGRVVAAEHEILDPQVVTFLQGACYLVISLCLLVVPSVQEFLDYQGKKRTEPKRPRK